MRSPIVRPCGRLCCWLQAQGRWPVLRLPAAGLRRADQGAGHKAQPKPLLALTRSGVFNEISFLKNGLQPKQGGGNADAFSFICFFLFDFDKFSLFSFSHFSVWVFFPRQFPNLLLGIFFDGEIEHWAQPLLLLGQGGDATWTREKPYNKKAKKNTSCK